MTNPMAWVNNENHEKRRRFQRTWVKKLPRSEIISAKKRCTSIIVALPFGSFCQHQREVKCPDTQFWSLKEEDRLRVERSPLFFFGHVILLCGGFDSSVVKGGRLLRRMKLSLTTCRVSGRSFLSFLLCYCLFLLTSVGSPLLCRYIYVSTPEILALQGQPALRRTPALFITHVLPL